jgi:predicted metal-dependent hydrolase
MLAISEKAKEIEIAGETMAFPKAWLPQAGAKLKHWYQVQAAAIFNDRMKLWRGRTGIVITAAGLSDARKRWGSCSGKGSININWRLVMAPADVIDYVIVHELAHIEHHDHSKAFWASVGEIMPGYKEKKKWLKENSALLRLF